MSKPAPLSRTKNATAPSWLVRPSSIRAWPRLAVNFHALPSRLSSAIAVSWGSASATRPGAITTSTRRAGSSRWSVADHGVGQRAEVDPLAAQLAARDPRQRQEVVDQLGHPLRRVADPGQVAPALDVEPVAVVLGQRLAEPVDRAQRGAQVVGDRVAERLQLLGGMAAVGDVVCDRDTSDDRAVVIPPRPELDAEEVRAGEGAGDVEVGGLAPDCGAVSRFPEGPPFRGEQLVQRSMLDGLDVQAGVRQRATGCEQAAEIAIKRDQPRARHAPKRGQMRVHRSLFGGPVGVRTHRSLQSAELPFPDP